MRHQHLEIQGFVPGQAETADAEQSLNEGVFGWLGRPRSDPLSEASIFENLLRVREDERQRLAQELHDSAGQLLVALELSIARLKLVETNFEHEPLIDEIQYNVHQIEREIRSLAFLHYPVELGDRCLHSAMQTLILGFGRRTGMHATFKSVGDRSPVDKSVSMAILRVTQEALVNIHRHSRASAIKAALTRRADVLHLTISDNGVGFPSDVTLQNAPGIGLKAMRHRIDMLGGRLRIRNLKRGAKVSAVVPVSMVGSAGF